MKDEEYNALREKIKKEEERRCKFDSLKYQIADFKRLKSDAFRECGGLAYITNMKIVITQSVDNTGDGRGGSHDENFEFNFNYDDKEKVKEIISKYIEYMEKELAKLEEED